MVLIRPKRRADTLTLLACIAYLLLFFQTLRYTSFFRRFGEWQFADLDIYFPGLTVVMALLAGAIVPALGLLIWRLNRRRLNRIREVPEATVESSPELLLAQTIASTATGIRCAYSIAAAASVAFLVCALTPIARNAVALDLVESASDGRRALPIAPVMGKVDVRRIALLRQGVGFLRNDVFIAPIIAAPRGEGRKQRYFAEIAPEDVDACRRSGDVALRGSLRPSVFPPQLVALYRSRGVDVAADAVVLFNSRWSRDWPYYIAAIQFSVLAVLAFLLAMLLRWRRRIVQDRLTSGLIETDDS
jgi:hypothetical protein